MAAEVEAEENVVDMVRTDPETTAPTLKVVMEQHMVSKWKLYKVERKATNKECMGDTAQMPLQEAQQLVLLLLLWV